jgi:DNA-binding PadR family transcriptional regulator
MPRTTQTDLAVLAALSVTPMTGYALREAILEHLGAFWSESFGQIYPALSRLREAGYVEAFDGERTGSSTYRLTASGRAQLVELMRDVLGARACRELVVEYRDLATRQLAELAEARRATEADDAGTPQRPYQLMTISAGEHSARAALAWADETLAALDALDAVGR